MIYDHIRSRNENPNLILLIRTYIRTYFILYSTCFKQARLQLQHLKAVSSYRCERRSLQCGQTAVFSNREKCGAQYGHTRGQPVLLARGEFMNPLYKTWQLVNFIFWTKLINPLLRNRIKGAELKSLSHKLFKSFGDLYLLSKRHQRLAVFSALICVNPVTTCCYGLILFCTQNLFTIKQI